MGIVAGSGIGDRGPEHSNSRVSEAAGFSGSPVPGPRSRDRAIAAYLQQHEQKPLLRFITCGSVDDGKSTLIGRLLYDSKRLFDDQLAALSTDSKRHGTRGGEIDYALLLDGLAAEREQGITIDVAYRYFDTDQRKFIVADCPGHEQYTRNMATGASTADVAVVLVDARKGLLTQTRRHSYIVSLLGIRHVVLAVNKMDLVDFDQATFDAIVASYHALAAQLGIAHVQCIPLSALDGDNLSQRSARTPWYGGPALLDYLEGLDLAARDPDSGLRLPVQWVNRPHQQFRGFAGTLAAGQVRPGDAVVVLPSARRSTVARVLDGNGDVDRAVAGQAVTLTLADEIDVSRGDVIAAADDPPEVADQFAAHVLWMDDAALLPGRPYWLKLGTRTVSASVSEIKHRIDVNTQERLAAKRLELNEVGYCNLSLDEAIAFAPYARNRALGGFILIDRQSNATVAAGTLDFALRRAGNVHWQHLDVDRAARAKIKGQAPKVLWFTGLSGAGKSTVANLVDKRLHALGYHTFILDGDNVRHGLNRDLGFTDEDRVENIRRVAEVARLMADAGLIVLVSFISPFRAERRMARERFAEGEFVEVFVDVPLHVAEARDVKGLYAKARAGQIPNFTGIDSPYEAPQQPELHLRADGENAQALAAQVLAWLDAHD
ncbi:sulfate adenylyltransferase subunit CysN [Xanthomonas graminis]|jgi:bifunctional enzyme CysN/CysC|uniref:Multifunctional fusion protein n=1 Tax=Xanthomonas graminis pv. graminis TaxID=134874 RepID=A0A1M4ID78_9XANT|nr:sulfate adenylyltransferase subunit CysN [Xanthomonas translucens]EKU26220.1 Sulfate adenylyltransferase subunit 1 / adenylyl- sulfate kinase [Xanthomonas translucens pv. graminis ART-Xtg29]OAX58923.1 adenylyl-sulfate kinase [Xanthomonas translucens pv. graminis]SBV40108.1 sulfate adenylyltransferase subunit 1 RaxQ [Xanthomonas translucens pv. graminis]SBV40293.1 sulfate adenylyltransferase subunit 1 RaxQ [Xanthomonas translucens pv. graminis]SBV46304.1 sulfate adenylyltransferase subunit 1